MPVTQVVDVESLLKSTIQLPAGPYFPKLDPGTSFFCPVVKFRKGQVQPALKDATFCPRDKMVLQAT